MTCGGCRSVVYCNAACQKNHWKSHKGICKEGVAQLKIASSYVAEAGDVSSMGYVAYHSAMGTGGFLRDDARSAMLYRRAADAGDIESEFKLGECLASGKGVEKDAKEAARWFLSAAKAGHASARVSLGRAYLFGAGVAQSNDAALRWFKLAAVDGFADAQYFLGLLLMAHGLGEQGIRWLRKAAAQGHAGAQAALTNASLGAPRSASARRE